METKMNNIGGFAAPKTAAQTFIASVFAWMAAALAITAIVAYQFGTTEYISYLMNPMTKSLTGLGFIVIFAPLGLVLLMGAGFNRLSASAIVGIFLIFSILMGMSLSFIFLKYSLGSIFGTFAISSGMFGTMALVGYTTKTDLTKFGSIMMMALVGLIIASLVNFFMHSSGLQYIISFLGVAIFTGLTAYDVQKLKGIAETAPAAGNEIASKTAIMGALTLYLDFINLFLFLLRFFGNKRN
jgi:hypothetical protein